MLSRTGCLARPARTQVGVFSATLPPEALEITRKFMNKPVGACLVQGAAAGVDVLLLQTLQVEWVTCLVTQNQGERCMIVGGTMQASASPQAQTLPSPLLRAGAHSGQAR